MRNPWENQGFFVSPVYESFTLVILIAVCQHVDMVCVYCKQKTQVTNSRLQKKQNNVWRRRHCLNCGANFTTLEKPDFTTALSVTDQNRYEPFLRDKLLLSVFDSLKHRKSALHDATSLTDTIIAQAYARISDGKIERSQLVSISLQTLQRFDKPAATYYAAYHPLELIKT